jgi:hypothetical protein
LGEWGATLVLWRCQRFCWERWCGRHLNCCRMRIQCKCRIFQLYLDGFLSFGDATLAWYCWWGQRNVSFHGGVVRSWTIGYCCKRLFCVHCNVRRIVFRFVPRRLCCNLVRLICKHLIMRICRGLGFFAFSVSSPSSQQHPINTAVRYSECHVIRYTEVYTGVYIVVHFTHMPKNLL